MNSRQRVLDAIQHRQPDRVPIDLGGTFVTGMHCTVVAALREHYGLERRPVRIHEPYQMLGYLEEDLNRAIGVDVQGIMPPGTMFGFPAEGWKPWLAPWGQELLVPGQFNATQDSAGNTFMYPEGDQSAPASGHLPRGGFFFDAIVRQQPIDDDKLSAADNLEEFKPISDADLQRITRGVADAKTTGRAVCVSTPGTGLGDIAQVPAPFLKHPRGIRDIEEWYVSIATRQDLIAEIYRQQSDTALRNLQRINTACGKDIDIVVLCGTDFGTQASAFCSVEAFRKLWLPYYRKMNDWIHQNTHWAVMKHSCGAVSNFIDSFIDSGFDILNPVQCSAAGMEPEGLKRRFGDRITFWGGGVDTQRTLPFSSPEQVREQVLRRLEAFSAGGGFVFNTIHNIQANTPVENVIAMINAIHEFNGAPV